MSYKSGQNRQIMLLVWIFLLVLFHSCHSGLTDEYTVISGSFKQSIIETGELEAVNASTIVMPRLSYQYGYQFKIIGLEEHGKIVQKGDSVVGIDPASIYKYILDRESQLENELAASKKQKVQMENNVQDLTAQLKSEKASYDLKKLELERIKFETENKRKIKELEFQQSTIKLNKVSRNLELKPKLDNYDMMIQQIKVSQRESELADARETLKKMVIKSPGDGVFQVQKSMFTGQFVRLGDNAYMGSVIASIPDISRMKAKTYVNETDIKKVEMGMKVIVRLDALPSVPFNGIVTNISKICSQRESEKVFNVEVEIAESDLRLKPGMTVSCEYICYESKQALFVPNSCLLNMDGHSYIVLGKGGSPKKAEVTTGPSNSTHTIISGNIKAGQRLVPVEKFISESNN